MHPMTACFAWLVAGADGVYVSAALQGLLQSSSWQPPCSTRMACMHQLATRARLAPAAQAACHWDCLLTWWGHHAASLPEDALAKFMSCSSWRLQSPGLSTLLHSSCV